MKTTLMIIVLFLSTSVWAASDVSSFHRLIVLNDKDEILLVQIKDVGFWVTPGWYQDEKQNIQTGLKNLAEDYGLVITPPKLKGMFSLKGQDNKIYSIRNVYVARAKAYQKTYPAIISDARWLPLEQATELMTFPHINFMLEQVINRPDKLWGGTIQRYKEKEAFKAKIVEPFYILGD